MQRYRSFQSAYNHPGIMEGVNEVRNLGGIGAMLLCLLYEGQGLFSHQQPGCISRHKRKEPYGAAVPRWPSAFDFDRQPTKVIKGQ